MTKDNIVDERLNRFITLIKESCPKKFSTEGLKALYNFYKHEEEKPDRNKICNEYQEYEHIFDIQRDKIGIGKDIRHYYQFEERGMSVIQFKKNGNDYDSFIISKGKKEKHYA